MHIRLCILFLLLANIVFSQNQTEKKKIIWYGIKTIYRNNTDSIKYLSFSNISNKANYGKIPEYTEIIPVLNENKIKIKIENQIFTELNAEESSLIKSYKEYIPENINEVETKIVYHKKKPYVLYSFIPFRYNPTSNKFERLTDFEIEITYLPQTQKKVISKPKSTQNSVLATGKWYKIGIPKSGIYKISGNDLKDMGFDVASIDPRNIRIYGNGGGMLPENNSSSRIDDLYENAIFVSGESDGKFDENDYILFFGEGPIKWSYNKSSGLFSHQTNYYFNTSSYFITTDLGIGKRITNQPSLTSTATHTVSNFNDYICHEKDSVNLIISGKEWYGENFDILTSYSFNFNFPNISGYDRTRIKYNIAARNTSQSSFSFNANGISKTSYINQYYGSYDYAWDVTDTLSLFSSNPNILVKVTKNTPNAIGWLNYIEINVIRNLLLNGSQMQFRNTACVGIGNISDFMVGNSNTSTRIWDITNPLEPKEQIINLSNNTARFRLQTDSLLQFIVFNGTGYFQPIKIGSVTNQNLHSLSPAQYIIISHPDFLTEAQRLALLHKTNDNLSYIIVTPQEIYNEFSSGNQDPSAIRDFIKMLYDKASSADNLPKYVLMFGDASYDYKDRLSENTNFVPTFQSPYGLDYTNSYATDDFFGLLDENEGPYLPSMLDVGIGRFPVKNITEAKAMVDKVAAYISNSNPFSTNNESCTSGAATSSGDWKNLVCFIADDEDYNNFVNSTEDFSEYIDSTYNNYNIEKIYCDSYIQQTGAGGQRYPDVNTAINKRVEKGALIINYVGHGGESGWTLERILEVSDILSWKNIRNLPLFATATCEFSRYDDPRRTSAGEYVLLNENGGGIALLTTSRLAWSGSNEALNRRFWQYALKKTNDLYPALGDLIIFSKNSNGNIDNNVKNFVLLGDPALKLRYPEYNIVTGMINNHSAYTKIDTLKAFEKVTISGYIQNESGQKISDYNGILYPSVFDKKTITSTLGNDATSIVKNYKIQKGLLYKGKVKIVNGDFSFTFIVPKDIGYKYDIGRISYYATDGKTDASGFYENNNFIIGGAINNFIKDITGPHIKLFMNDSTFVNGGITDENPIIRAYVKDSSGINTTGNGIGHDIIAVIDGNTVKPIILNDFYEADVNSYQSGSIRYQLENLEEGPHTLKLKVWDIYNNSSETSIDFVVQNKKSLELKHVFNYPNPFTSKTKFFFEHNQPCCALNVQIQIFTITGKLVKTIMQDTETAGFRAQPIEWDGVDDYGDQLAKGVYIYKITVKNEDGLTAEKIEKLVII